METQLLWGKLSRRGPNPCHLWVALPLRLDADPLSHWVHPDGPATHTKAPLISAKQQKARVPCFRLTLPPMPPTGPHSPGLSPDLRPENLTSWEFPRSQENRMVGHPEGPPTPGKNVCPPLLWRVLWFCVQGRAWLLSVPRSHQSPALDLKL